MLHLGLKVFEFIHACVCACNKFRPSLLIIYSRVFLTIGRGSNLMRTQKLGDESLFLFNSLLCIGIDYESCSYQSSDSQLARSQALPLKLITSIDCFVFHNVYGQCGCETLYRTVWSLGDAS